MAETIERQLLRLGWELESSDCGHWFHAECGNFGSGPWRKTPQEVLDDVLKMKSSPGDLDRAAATPGAPSSTALPSDL